MMISTPVKIREWEDAKYFYSIYSIEWRGIELQYTVMVDWDTFEPNLFIDREFALQFGGASLKELMASDEGLDLMNHFKERYGKYPIIQSNSKKNLKTI